MIVEFYEGAIADNQLVDAVELDAPPQIGAIFVFDVENAGTYRFEVISVEHVVEKRLVDMTHENRQVAVRCSMMAR